jgi:hypothetical protein
MTHFVLVSTNVVQIYSLFLLNAYDCCSENHFESSLLLDLYFLSVFFFIHSESGSNSPESGVRIERSLCFPSFNVYVFLLCDPTPNFMCFLCLTLSSEPKPYLLPSLPHSLSLTTYSTLVISHCFYVCLDFQSLARFRVLFARVLLLNRALHGFSESHSMFVTFQLRPTFRSTFLFFRLHFTINSY